MLEKAYADVNRMVFVVFIKSPQEGLLASSALLKDTTGVELNTGLGISSPPDDPTRFIIEFFSDTGFATGQFKGELVVEIGTKLGPAPGWRKPTSPWICPSIRQSSSTRYRPS